jgi:membrane protein DedA with SNARE-associated domain
MIEILVLYKLCKDLGRNARAKGRRAIGYQLLLILFWIGGEFFGTFVGAIALVVLGELLGGLPEAAMLLVYAAALAGAIFGAWIVFRIVRNLPEPIAEDEPVVAETVG